MAWLKSNYLQFFLAGFISFCSYNSFATTLYTYTGGGSSGNWSTAATWTTDATGLTSTGSAVPANSDVVVILNGYTVTLSANVTTTGLSITIQSGGTLNMSTFTMVTISSLSGSGTLRLQSGNFPTVTTNNFTSSSSSGATVEYYDFTGSVPASLSYPNVVFSNSTTSNFVISFDNSSAYTATINGTFTTRTTSTGTLTVNFGTQDTNIITLGMTGNVSIGAGTTWGVGTFNAIHKFTLSGNLTNNGTISFSNGTQYATSTTGAADIVFTGATDNSMACNGTTNLYTLTINKGVGSANIFSVTSTNTTNLNLYSSGQLITITAGTLRLGSNISIPRIQGTGTANYNVGSTGVSPMLWIDGASVNFNGAALVVYGKFRITAGSFTTTGGQGSVIREEGIYMIEGGTFTTEKFRPSTTATTHRGTFTMSGGTFNASGTTASDNSYARFSLPYPDQVFIMSGGTINVSNPESGGSAANGGIHIGCSSSNYMITGGTFNAILSGSASQFYISSVAPFWDLNITRTGGTPTTVKLNGIGSVTNTVTSAQPLQVLDDLTINGTNTPTLNAAGLNVTVGHNFTINSGATYTPGSNTTTFNGSSDQSFSNSGTITSGLYGMTVNKASGTLTLGGSASSYTVTSLLSLTNGILNDGGKTILATGNLYNEAVHTGTGNITLSGSSTQTISGDGNGVFGNITLSNSSTPGATATADFSVSGILTLAGTTSLLDLSFYQLTLTSTSVGALTTTGNPFSSSKMIRTQGLQSDRGIVKNFGNLSAFTYAFGVGSIYSPATIQLNSAPTAYGLITARPVSSRHQFVAAGNTNNLQWYWKLSSTGFNGLGATAVSHTYQYSDASVSPSGDDANYVPARYNPTTWTVINDLTQVNETTNVISFTNVGYIDGDYTAGVPSAFGVVNIFYSKRNGNWSDTGAGTTPWSNVSHTGADATTTPGSGDQVIIGDGSTINHTITITANNMSSGGLDINLGSTLDIGTTTGHNFGQLANVQISGGGLLRISSATSTAEFPAGDFGNFIRSSGGSVEYYSTGSQDFTIPLTSRTPTSLPLISYKNLLLTPGSGRSIIMPDQDMKIYGSMTVQGVSSTGIGQLNSANARQLEIDGNLYVNSGNLQFRNGAAQSITLYGSMTVSSGAIFNVSASGTPVANSFYLEGSIVNNGILDFSSGSYYCNITFGGTVNASITGSGTINNFNSLIVSKGTSQAPLLEVNSSVFSLSSSTTPLSLLNGTFRLTSTQSIVISNGQDFSVPSTAKLSANGGTMQITGTDGIDLLLSGTLELISGTINVGTTTTNDNSVEYAATGSPAINVSGGQLNVQGQVRRSVASSQGALTFNLSGPGGVAVGTASVTATTRGVFEILNTSSSFTMSGGTLSIARSTSSTTIADLYVQPASNSVTGGTIQIGTGSTSQTIDINTLIPFYNLSVVGTTNTTRLEYNPLTLRGSMNIGAGNVFKAMGFNVNVAGDFVNQNTTSSTGVSTGGYQAGSTTQTTTINGSSSNQVMTGVSGNLTNFGNLTFNNTFTNGTVTLSANTNLRVNGTLTMTSGTVVGNDNIITAISTVSNSTTCTNTSAGSIKLSGSSAQTITGNGSGKFGNLILNNASGAAFGANQEITGVLTLTSGSLLIGSYNLNMSNTSLSAISGSSSSRFIVTSGLLSDGGITKAFSGSL
ncbi:MAG: hypothetical protein QM734_11815, partial [Cyclobacteriaceae bacterium]